MAERIVKVFEQFVEDEMEKDQVPSNPEPEDVPQEDEEELVKQKLSSGEKAALTKGLDVITDSQMAALYLVAKTRLAKREDQSDTYAGRQAQKMNRDVSNDDFRDVTYGRLADLLNMKPLTVSRTTNKFMLLMKGEERESEVLYAKIIEAFEKFKSMQEAEVLGLAQEAVDPNASTDKSDAFRDKTSQQSAKTRENKISRDKAIGQSVKSLYNSLKGQFGEEKAARMSVSKVAGEKGLDPAAVKAIVQEFLKGEPTLRARFK